MNTDTHARFSAALAWLMIFTAGLKASPQESGDKFFPQELNGTMMPYDFSATDTVVPWAGDMTPVFMAYVARHGARFLSSEKKVSEIREKLLEARSAGGLTERGLKFLGLLDTVDSVTSGRWGALNATGINEQVRLADELSRIAPDLLKSGNVLAESSYVPRVVMTMYQLLHGLSRYSSNLEIAALEGKRFSPMVRFFDTDSAYVHYLKEGIWRQVYNSFEEETTPAHPAETLFADGPGRPDRRELKNLTNAMYSVLQSLPASRIGWKPGIWFTPSEYRRCWEVANLKHYLQRSSNRYSGLPAEAAAPVLREIVSCVDSVIGGTDMEDRQSARMWFGHAETVMPLFAIMGLPGCSKPDLEVADVAREWRDWEVSPLGANLVLVLLRDSSRRYHIAARLNGRWVKLLGSRVISWDSLRGYWLSRAGMAKK